MSEWNKINIMLPHMAEKVVKIEEIIRCLKIVYNVWFALYLFVVTAISY